MKVSSQACSFIIMQIKVIFIRMVSHLDSLWNRGKRTRKWPIYTLKLRSTFFKICPVIIFVTQWTCPSNFPLTNRLPTLFSGSYFLHFCMQIFGWTQMILQIAHCRWLLELLRKLSTTFQNMTIAWPRTRGKCSISTITVNGYIKQPIKQLKIFWMTSPTRGKYIDVNNGGCLFFWHKHDVKKLNCIHTVLLEILQTF